MLDSKNLKIIRIASRIASLQPLSERPDYGKGEASVPRGENVVEEESSENED